MIDIPSSILTNSLDPMVLHENVVPKTWFAFAVYAYSFYLLYLWEIHVEKVINLIRKRAVQCLFLLHNY